MGPCKEGLASDGTNNDRKKKRKKVINQVDALLAQV
jgi:hypothetical protein